MLFKRNRLSKMSSQCFVCIFFSVYVLQLSRCVDPERDQTPASGPFKASIASIGDCSHPTKPYAKNPPVVFHPTTHNRSMSGTITFLRDTKAKIRIRGFVLRNGKWEPAYLINNPNCHGIVLHLMCVTMNIKYDRKNCLYFKGTYSFENLDVNQLLHSWISNAQYGRILWRSETYSQAGTFTCKEFDTMIDPA